MMTIKEEINREKNVLIQNRWNGESKLKALNGAAGAASAAANAAIVLFSHLAYAYPICSIYDIEYGLSLNIWNVSKAVAINMLVCQIKSDFIVGAGVSQRCIKCDRPKIDKSKCMYVCYT